MIDLSVTVNYDDAHQFGNIKFDFPYPHLEEYALMPTVMKQPDGTIEVVGYSFVHHTKIMPPEEWRKRLDELDK